LILTAQKNKDEGVDKLLEELKQIEDELSIPDKQNENINRLKEIYKILIGVNKRKKIFVNLTQLGLYQFCSVTSPNNAT